ncbi:ferritin family protein [Kineothrix sp. IPX-CK]|uniref:Ferritin family protein n=2 Tax=Kineothrix sedimenti TaxID=3123317 RepID=A0ABZ3ESD2_9FIRM
MVMSNNFTCNISVNLPYPEIQPESQNPQYALAMLSNVGSSNSEMTAVSLYFYNSVILDPLYVNFAKCFHEISIVEMHHLNIFADLAFKMGADPRLWSVQNRRKAYWTPAFNQYPREIRSIIVNSIKGEEAAIRKYRSQTSVIRDANIKSILERIILDEERHIEIFNNMLSLIS